MLSHAEFWTVILLAVVLKLPLALVLWAIWYGAKLADRAETPPPVHEQRMALCGYCGHRIAIGYDAAEMHREATLIARVHRRGAVRRRDPADPPRAGRARPLPGRADALSRLRRVRRLGARSTRWTT